MKLLISINLEDNGLTEKNCKTLVEEARTALYMNIELGLLCEEDDDDDSGINRVFRLSAEYFEVTTEE
jgi:hypothetical protein